MSMRKSNSKRNNNKQLIGGKDFDGPAAVSVTTEDLGVYTREEVDNAFVKKTQVLLLLLLRLRLM